MKFCVIIISCLIFRQAVGLTINQGTPVPFNILKSGTLERSAPIKNFLNFLQGNQLRYGGSQARALALSGANTGSFSHSESFSSGGGQSKSSSSSLSFTGLPINNGLFNTFFNENNVAFSPTKEPSRSINVDDYRSKIDVRYDHEHPISEWDISKGKSTSSSATFSYNGGAVPVATSFASSSSGSIRGGGDAFSHSQAGSLSDGYGGSESSAGAFTSSNSRNAVESATEPKKHSGLFIAVDANEKPIHSLSGNIKGPNFKLGGNTFLIKEDCLEQHRAGSFSGDNNIFGKQNGGGFTTSRAESSAYQSVNGGSSSEAYNGLFNHKNGAISGSQAESVSSGQLSNFQSESDGGFSGNGAFSGSQEVSSTLNNHNGGSFSSSNAESVSAQNGGNFASSPSSAFNNNGQNGGSFSISQAESSGIPDASISESSSGVLNDNGAFGGSQAGSLQFNNHNGGSFSSNRAKQVGVENGGSYAAPKHKNSALSSTQAGNQNTGNEGSFSDTSSITNGGFGNSQAGSTSSNVGSSSKSSAHNNIMYLNTDIKPFTDMQTGLIASFPKSIEMFTNYNNAFSNSQSESSSSTGELFASSGSSSSAGSQNSAFGNSQASSSAGLLSNGNSFSSSQAGSFSLTGQNTEGSSLAHNIFLNSGVGSFAGSQSGSTSEDFHKDIELFTIPNGAGTFTNSYAESSSGSGLVEGNFASPFHQQQTLSSSKSEASSGSSAYQHGTFASSHSGTNPTFVNKGNVAFSKSHASSSGRTFSESKSESFSGSF